MSEFSIFNNGTKKVIIRTSRIISVLELDTGCYIHTDDGGEYGITNPINQVLQIIGEPSDIDDTVNDEPVIEDIESGLHISDHSRLLNDLCILKRINNNDFNYDARRQCNVESLARKAFDAAIEKKYDTTLMYLEGINTELELHNDNDTVSDRVKDAISDAYIAIHGSWV